jgi:iron complex outermembrane receptor protein
MWPHELKGERSVTMKNKEQLLRSTIIAGAAAALFATPAFAQDSDVETTDDDEQEEEAGGGDDRIVITGSRIRRDEFSSASPLQIIDSETIAEAGVIDVGEILSRTTVVQGVQLDQQFQSLFRSDAGPAGSFVGLRGFGPERTLTMVNGRRLAPSGVSGAPSYPDISLLPSSMIERVDILLDGASSVYGSDAVGGVINFILRDDFEGFEINAQHNIPEHGGREQSRVNFIVGGIGDQFSFSFGGEYVLREELLGNERDWMCDVESTPYTAPGATDITNDYPSLVGQGSFCATRDIAVDENGNHIETIGGSYIQNFTAFPYGVVLLGRPSGTGGAGAFGGLFPDFVGYGGDLGELTREHMLREEDAMILPQEEQLKFFLSADYDLDAVLPGSSAFVEFSFSNNQTYLNRGAGQILVAVTPDNPYIPIEWPGAFGALGAPASPFTTTFLTPFDQTTEVELTQWRIVGGLEGDLGMFGVPSWDYEVFGAYTRSQGFADLTGVLEEQLLASMNTYVNPATGFIECRPEFNPVAPIGGTKSLEPCVPLNPLFAGLYTQDGSIGEFEDPRSLDYLRGSRTSTTFVDQTVLGGFVTGPVYTLPAGDVQVVAGVEWREDAIDTRSDEITARGLLNQFFVDRPTRGSVELFEVFGEVSVPILSGQMFAENLEVNLSGRYVEHEFYGENTTYSGNVIYSPFNWLTLRGTYGTSFRAPNLRELFLTGQSAFASINDPCVVPALARTDSDGDGLGDTYTPGADADGDGIGDDDGRSQTVISNCQAEGLDPFSFGLGLATPTPEVFDAGNTGLQPEESTAWTVGVVYEQPFFDWIDARVGVTFFEYEITDSVLQPSANFLVASCYSSPDFPDAPFCTRRSRDPNTNFINEIDTTPFNVASRLSSGYDVNMSLAGDFELFGRSFEATSDFVATHTDEVSTLLILPGEEPDFDDSAGDYGNPYWRFTANQNLRFDDFSVAWQVRYIGDYRPREISEVDGGLVGAPANCDGANAGDVVYKPCFKVDAIWYHDLSVAYTQDTWAIRFGIQNVLDQDPPQIDEDASAALNARNVPVGVGYDNVGRSFFMNVSKSF